MVSVVFVFLAAKPNPGKCWLDKDAKASKQQEQKHAEPEKEAKENQPCVSVAYLSCLLVPFLLLRFASWYLLVCAVDLLFWLAYLR